MAIRIMIGSVAVSRKGLYKATPNRCTKVSDRISISALYRSSPVRSRKCFAFHLSKTGGKVSGWKKTTIPSTTADMIRVIQSTQRHERYGLWTIKPPITGPSRGPANAATAKIGKV
jgi:hypothetical protein